MSVLSSRSALCLLSFQLLFTSSEALTLIRQRDVVFNGNKAALKACFGANYEAAGSPISHCFMEHDTHNTCCMMDKKTRDANDAAGNPIGKASLDAYIAINGAVADDTDLLTPWCTCFGSQVCSHYASMPDTKTKIKFINDCGCATGTPGKGFCMDSVPKNELSGCEGWARTEFQMPAHETPGVGMPSGDHNCPSLQGKAEGDISSCPLTLAPSPAGAPAAATTGTDTAVKGSAQWVGHLPLLFSASLILSVVHL